MVSIGNTCHGQIQSAGFRCSDISVLLHEKMSKYSQWFNYKDVDI